MFLEVVTTGSGIVDPQNLVPESVFNLPQMCSGYDMCLEGNTHTSGLVSGLVPIRSSDCGAKFKPGYFLVCIKNSIRNLSLTFQDLEDFQSGQELFQS